MIVADGHGRDTPTRIDASTRLSVVVAGACLLLLAAIVVPAAMHARMEARRRESANQLKTLALGLDNYQHSQRGLPPGASLSTSGDELHGWFTALLPYLYASQVPGMIEKTLPWNHELNAPFFRGSNPAATGPGDSGVVTKEG